MQTQYSHVYGDYIQATFVFQFHRAAYKKKRLSNIYLREHDKSVQPISGSAIQTL
jgi:hypothetical protein